MDTEKKTTTTTTTTERPDRETKSTTTTTTKEVTRPREVTETTIEEEDKARSWRNRQLASTITFKGISPQVFERLKQKLAGQGIDLPSTNSGMIDGSGIKAEYSWDGAENLSIEILKKPVFLPTSVITKGIQSTIQECGGAST